MRRMQRRSFDELVQLMTTLRGPDGCPWDRKQTLPSLKPFIIEEAYEVVDAIDDSITAIHEKLVRRHPHVFGDVEAKDAEQVLVNWEKLKNEERKAEDKSLLAGVPQALPALLKASRLTEKAARVGFDWRGAEDVFAKVDEEL